ncbi:MAG: hypothetical protein Q9168_003398 [Polycauliona sp. 1 TL-2023]
MMIGVALGSPGKSPLPPLPPEDSIPWSPASSALQNHKYAPPIDLESPSSKASRWKTLGGFFGKRSGGNQASAASSPHHFGHRASPLGPHRDHDASVSPPPSYQSSHEHAILRAQGGAPRDWIGPGQLPSQPDRERRTLRKKPSLRRDQHASKKTRDVKPPVLPKTGGGTGPQAGGPKHLPKDAPLGYDVGQPRAKASLLQVDIPDIEFERYSVMFSNLLQPCQQPATNAQPSPKRQPSLLVRRQASLQELDTTPVSTFERPWVHREDSSSPRAASPHKSPSFSLFPPSSGAAGRKLDNSSRERSPLQRSATTPGAVSPSKAMFDFSTPTAVSPSKAKFDFGTDHTDQVFVIVHSPTEQQQPKPRQFSRHQSSFSSSDAQSFTTARGSPAPEQQQQAQQSLQTPRSQLRNPSPQRPSPADRSTSNERRSPNTAKSPSQSADRNAAPKPQRNDSNSNIRNLSPAGRSPNRSTTAAEDPQREAAEISIARQISISQRQRRQLLIPPQSVAVQPLQPRIVDTRDHAARKSYHSHHLVLEEA